MRARLLPLAAVLLGVLAAGCSDEGQPGPSTGSTSGSLTPDGGAGEKKATGAVGCTDNAECASQVCFKGNAQSFCTVNCTPENAAQICLAPLTGSCNRQGYCKRD